MLMHEDILSKMCILYLVVEEEPLLCEDSTFNTYEMKRDTDIKLGLITKHQRQISTMLVGMNEDKSSWSKCYRKAGQKRESSLSLIFNDNVNNHI